MKGINITRGHRGNNFNGYFGVGLNNDSLYLPNHAFDNYKDENISIGDTLKVWNFGNKSDLLLNYGITKDKTIFLYSISKSLFVFLICNSLWIWFFIRRKSNLPKS